MSKTNGKEAGESFHMAWILRRADGEPIDGDMISWYRGGHGDKPDWEQAEYIEYYEPTVMVAERVQVVETVTRTYGEIVNGDDD